MPCTRCETIPKLTHESCQVLLTAQGHGPLQAARKFLEQQGLRYSAEPQVLRLPDVDFPALLALMRDSAHLNPAVCHDLLALPLKPGETLHFGLFAQARALESWIGLLGAQELIEILDQQRLTTWFQPIIDTAGHDIIGYECLLRGLAPDGTPIAPNKLLQSALHCDLLHVLDRLARASALNTAARLGIEQNLFINFMPRVIYDPHECMHSTFELVKHLGLKPEQIVFEVVEYEQLDDIAHLHSIFDVYREAGYRVALDDLGSGYSTLNMMAELKPDIIKIDRALIDNCDHDHHKRSMIHALVDVAHALNIQVVAEGVERPGEFNCIRDQGADLAQGYLFARPAAIPLATLAGTSC